jgi:hypothetical protein
MARGPIAIALAVVVALGAAIWFVARADDETTPIRRRLQAFCDDVNGSTTDGAGPEARAVQLGSYFTEDAEVDFGRGSTPITGRETLISMAGRLQPRTAAFSLKFVDVTIVLAPGGDAADVHLTAEFIRRSITTGDQSLDAREFSIAMRRTASEWRMSRVTAVETLR